MKTILSFIVFGWIIPHYNLKNTPVTSIPFDLVQNLIIVKATANGKEGYFVVDTGVSETILNKRYFKGSATGIKFYGIHGNEIENEIWPIKLNIEGFEKNMIGVIIDFTALEKKTGLDLLGVVGNSLFKNCELVLDYTFKELTIYRLNKEGNRISSKNIHQEPQSTLPIILGKGLALIEVKMNGKKLKMILDTGASANVMDIQEINHIGSGSSRVREVSMAGFGKNIIQVKSSKVNEWMVGNLPCPPMKTLFVTLNQLNQNNWGNRVDGILGYNFLCNFRVSINFRKKEIHLWDRESVELQLANAKKSDNAIGINSIKY
ncbi:retropepsin-like aspartic protease [Aquiflexum lacus]|uniref:retropepsin-like aspartic protease n=1 Tax=Aquiflexum lacus TaxID=2483805 RepID=UPI0018957519|nr:retropepsin-like aspartic protease [Aquiflexum lacus]